MGAVGGLVEGTVLVPEAATRLRYAGVAFRELALDDPAPVEFSLAWRRKNDNPALHALFEEL